MIDFVRVHYRDKSRLETFIMKPENFNKMYSVLEYHSGEVLFPFRVNLQNMELVVNEKSGYVKNSIHKLNNVLLYGDEHNYNDFSYSQLCSTIDYLYSKVIDIASTRLSQLEFGLNIKIPIPAEQLISDSVLMHRFERHSGIHEYGSKGYLMTFEHSNYIIKIYDKAKQYNLKDQNILRFEIKFLNAKEFNSLGVFNLNDLKSKDVLNNLFQYLLMRFDELLIIDNYSEESILKEDFQKLNMYSSFIYWDKLTKANRRQTKLNHKLKYYSLLNKYNLLSTRDLLKNLLKEKFHQLINN